MEPVQFKPKHSPVSVELPIYAVVAGYIHGLDKVLGSDAPLKTIARKEGESQRGKIIRETLNEIIVKTSDLVVRSSLGPFDGPPSSKDAEVPIVVIDGIALD